MRHIWRQLLLITALGLALLAGAPLRPDQFEELLHQVHRPKVAHSLRQQAEPDD